MYGRAKVAKIKLHTDPNNIKNTHVIFLHGLGGNSDCTWLDRDSKTIAWPMWLAEDCDYLNIWSVEYKAPKFTFSGDGMGIADLATNILEHMLQMPELSNGEILFVCHSLGGLIIKQLLRIANDQTLRESSQQFIGRVTGVAFLGTPH